MAQSQRKKKDRTDNRNVILPAIILLVGLAGVIAFATSGGSDEPSGTTLPPQFQQVAVTGSTLAPLGDDGTGNVDDPMVGQQAPALAGRSFSSAEISVTPGTDTAPTLLVFLAHWCPHCNRELPLLVEMNDKNLFPEGLRVVGVVTSSREDQANWPPSRWISEKGWPFEVLVDDEMSKAANSYGVDGFPFMVVVGADGKVKARHSGEMEIPEVQSWLTTALAS